VSTPAAAPTTVSHTETPIETASSVSAAKKAKMAAATKWAFRASKLWTVGIQTLRAAEILLLEFELRIETVVPTVVLTGWV
jgi:hypothetical protein